MPPPQYGRSCACVNSECPPLLNPARRGLPGRRLVLQRPTWPIFEAWSRWLGREPRARGTQNTHPAKFYFSRWIPLFAGVPLVAQIVRSFSRSLGGGEGVHS